MQQLLNGTQVPNVEVRGAKPIGEAVRWNELLGIFERKDMSFDDIPEDKEPSYECGCGGNIKTNPKTGVWECDQCDWNENKDVTPGYAAGGKGELE